MLSSHADAFVDADLAPHLSAQSYAKISEILQRPVAGQNAEAAEASYRGYVRKQLLGDLKEFYDSKNEKQIEVAYAAFTPYDAHRGGADLGYGLHVVKRLAIPVAGGKTKILFVNEHWGENVNDRGLYLPDEIRVQSLVADGKRHVPGSHNLYLFDSYRIGWTETGKAVIAQRSVYKWNERDEKNERMNMRVPVSAPYSCRGCHAAQHTKFVEPFLTQNVPRDFETIVQGSYFKLPVERMKGFREYIAYLTQQGVQAKFIERVEEGLKNPAKRFALPAMVAAIDQTLDDHSVITLGEDVPIGVHLPEIGLDRHQGVYYHWVKKGWHIDHVESLVEGKYVWWEPKSAIP